MHASDADQAEALLRRWGPDGVGKLGGMLHINSYTSIPSNGHAVDPNWAHPIKKQIRTQKQERAIAEVMHNLHPTPVRFLDL